MNPSLPLDDQGPTRDETPELLRRWCRDGDRAALDRVLTDHLDYVHRRVRQRMGGHLRSDLDSLDVVQEVAVDVLRYGPRFVAANAAQLRGLLARMVENNLRDRARRGAAAKRDRGRERPKEAPSVDLAASAAGPATEIATAERDELVRLAVELLDEGDREVVRRHQLEGAPMRDVAAELGVAITTAHMRYQRALPRLALRVQELLRGECDP